jgi:hypothetical protein
MRINSFKFEYVEYIPDKIKNGVIYISINYNTAVHLCACGCCREVVTPLSPVDWSLIYNGISISLHPSIGNWSFPCQSHYWIKNNQVKWAEKWSNQQIANGRANDKYLMDKYYDQNPNAVNPKSKIDNQANSIWEIFKKWFLNK